MISNKTVGLLTALRELCEALVEDTISDGASDDIYVASKRLDAVTDIMDCLMDANAIEQQALLAKKCGVSCGGDVADAVNRVFGNNDKEETVN